MPRVAAALRSPPLGSHPISRLSYKGRCVTDHCDRQGAFLDLGEAQPLYAPLCRDCGNPMQVYVPTEKAKP